MLARHHKVLVAISRIRRSLRRLTQEHLWSLRPCLIPGFSDRRTSGILISLHAGELRQDRHCGTSPTSECPLKKQVPLILEGNLCSMILGFQIVVVVVVVVVFWFFF